jgi:hypothetical protein
MEVGYCRLVTISTDNITETKEYRTGVGAHWPFLSDTRRIVQKDLDIAEYTDPVHNPMIPHVIVLEQENALNWKIQKLHNRLVSSSNPPNSTTQSHTKRDFPMSCKYQKRSERCLF